MVTSAKKPDPRTATPGPWTCTGKVHRVDGTDLWCGSINPVSAPKFRGPIANIQSADHIGGISIEEARANAYLLAAAPDLAKALEPFAAHADRYAVGAPDTADGMQVYVSLGECRAASALLATLCKPATTARSSAEGVA